MSVRATRRRKQAFEEFAHELADALGEEIHEIILYGSTARGEATERSDIDVLIVVEGHPAQEYREAVSRLAFEIGLEHDVAISYHLQSRERFEERREVPFLQNVLKEGHFYG